MAKLSHYIEYSLVMFGAFIVQSMSASGADRFGAFLGRNAQRLLRSRNRIALENLQNAFPELSVTEREKIAVEAFENLGRAAVEVARFGVTSRKRITEIVVNEGREAIDNALSAGKGGIFVTAHFGCWEMTGAWLGASGYPTDLLVLSQHNGLFDRTLDGFRKKMGVGTLVTGEDTRRMFRALKENRLIGIAADQHDPSQNLIIDFFGRPAAAARGPALFSIRTGAPILPFMLRRIRHDRHEFISAPPIYPSSGLDENENVRLMVEKYHRFYEKVIRQYPGQWMWTHRRWKVKND